jgi:hypothetical protein
VKLDTHHQESKISGGLLCQQEAMLLCNRRINLVASCVVVGNTGLTSMEVSYVASPPQEVSKQGMRETTVKSNVNAKVWRGGTCLVSDSCQASSHVSDVEARNTFFCDGVNVRSWRLYAITDHMIVRSAVQGTSKQNTWETTVRSTDNTRVRKEVLALLRTLARLGIM